MADLIAELLRKPYYAMSEAEYDDAVNAMLKGVRYNRPLTDEGYDEPTSRSGMIAREMAMLALDRGVPMYQPAGPNLTYTDQQLGDTYAQQPPTNKLFTPAQDIAARTDLAARKAMFQNALRNQQTFYNPGAGPEYDPRYSQGSEIARNRMLSYLQPYLERFGLYQK